MRCAASPAGSAVASVARLWNPRSNHKLHRYWVSFEDRIIIAGESLEQTGVLSLQRVNPDALRARLRVMGCEFEEIIGSGNDLAVWINGLELFVGVKAIEDRRMLIAFGIPPASKVKMKVTLDTSDRVEVDAKISPRGDLGVAAGRSGLSIGLCQTRH